MSTTLEACKEHVERLNNKYNNNTSTIVTCISYKNVQAFTTLFIIDILHDYREENSTIKTTLSELKKICHIVATGLYVHSRHKDTMNTVQSTSISLYTNKIYKGLIEFLTNIGALNTQTTNRVIAIRKFKQRIFNYYSKSMSLEPVDDLQKIPYLLLPDTCKIGRFDPLCDMFEKVQKIKTVIPLATLYDKGYVANHTGYDYCLKGMNYIFVNFVVTMDFRTEGGSIISFGNMKYERIDVNYPNNQHGVNFLYTKYADSLEKQELSLQNTTKLKKSVILDTLNDTISKLHELTDVKGVKTVSNTYDLLLNKFYGDFGQVLNLKALNDTGRLENACVLTNDKMLAIISVIIARHPVVTKIKKKPI